MRVNSVFTGFFTNRLVVRSGIAIVMLAVFFIASSFTKRSDRDVRAKPINGRKSPTTGQLKAMSRDQRSRIEELLQF